MKKASIIVILLIATGCGYHLVGHDSLRSKVESVAIPIFENATTEPNIEYLFTEALKQEFIKRNFKVGDLEEADVIFRGKIVKFYTVGVAKGKDGRTLESRIYIVLDMRCEDRAGKVLWQNNQLSYDRIYPHYEGISLESFQARQAVLKHIAEKVSSQIYTQFVHKLK